MGPKERGGKIGSFLGNVYRDPSKQRKLKDPRNKDPVCVSSLALPGAHFLAS